MRRCDRRIRHGTRRGRWYCLRRCGHRGIGVGISNCGVQSVPQVGKRCAGIRHARFGRQDLIDVLGECGHQQLQGLGIAVLEWGIENRTGFGTELRECLRGEVDVVSVATCRAVYGCGAVVTAGKQTREQVRQGRGCTLIRPLRGRPRIKSGAGLGLLRSPSPQSARGGRGVLRARTMHPAGCEGLRGEGAPQGRGKADAGANDAAHRAAEAADEARTNPLAGLGRKAGSGERDRHWIGV